MAAAAEVDVVIACPRQADGGQGLVQHRGERVHAGRQGATRDGVFEHPGIDDVVARRGAAAVDRMRVVEDFRLGALALGRGLAGYAVAARARVDLVVTHRTAHRRVVDYGGFDSAVVRLCPGVSRP